MSSPTTKNMLIPKGNPEPYFIPALPRDDLAFTIGELAHRERQALSEIVETADLITVDDQTFLLARVGRGTLDVLAAFGAEAEDRENDLEDEDMPDREPDDEPEDGDPHGMADPNYERGRGRRVTAQADG